MSSEDKLYLSYAETRKNLSHHINKAQRQRKHYQGLEQNRVNQDIINVLTIRLSLLNSMRSDVEFAMTKMEEGFKNPEDRKLSNRGQQEFIKHSTDKRTIQGLHPDGEIVFCDEVNSEIPSLKTIVDVNTLIEDCSTDKQAQVVVGYFFYGLNTRELGEILNISQQVAHKQLNASLSKMQSVLHNLDVETICLSDIIPQKHINDDILTKFEQKSAEKVEKSTKKQEKTRKKR